MKAKITSAWLEVLPDEDADTSYLDQDEFETRREEYREGSFSFVGVRACAAILFETEQGGWIHGPTVTTPGLWGIEDDSGEDYLREVGADEAAQLPEMLEALGIDASRARYAESVAKLELRYP